MNRVSLVSASPFFPTGLGSSGESPDYWHLSGQCDTSLWEDGDSAVAACLCEFLNKARKFRTMPKDVVCKMLYV
jgi:hypothetical protein